MRNVAWPMIKVKEKSSDILAMLDLCWFFAFAYAIYGILCVIASSGVESLKLLTSSSFCGSVSGRCPRDGRSLPRK